MACRSMECPVTVETRNETRRMPGVFHMPHEKERSPPRRRIFGWRQEPGESQRQKGMPPMDGDVGFMYCCG